MHRLSVAPMMDRTDRHCRFFHRLLSRHTRLYTEMLTAGAVIHGDRDRLLGFDPAEHPVALQLGGSEPAMLAQAARIGERLGYDEINLNCGCPSDRVKKGRFGASLMAEPELVGRCLAAMRGAVSVPVTVKCRVGIDEQDDDALDRFVETVHALSGVTVFIVHARKAWLKGLNPKQNREVPPLRYELAFRLKAERPDLCVVLNGGVPGLDAAEALLAAGRRGRRSCWAAPPIRTLGCSPMRTAACSEPRTRCRRGMRRWKRCCPTPSGWRRRAFACMRSRDMSTGCSRAAPAPAPSAATWRRTPTCRAQAPMCWPKPQASPPRQTAWRPEARELTRGPAAVDHQFRAGHEGAVG